MRHTVILLALTVLLGLGFAACGSCSVPGEIVLWGDINDKPATNAANYAPASAEIKIDSTVFFEIRTGAIGYTVAERETIVLKRLVEVYSSGKIAPVFVSSVRGCPTIYVDRIRLITVYPEDVMASGARNARALAEQWADGVRKSLLLTAPSACFGGAPTYTVAIGGKVFFRLIDPQGFANVRDRGRAVDARLADIVSEYDPALVATVAVPGGVAVTFKGQPVVVASAADARPRGLSSAGALASAWASNLRSLMPLIKTGLPAAQ